jgi:protease-4
MGAPALRGMMPMPYGPMMPPFGPPPRDRPLRAVLLTLVVLLLLGVGLIALAMAAFSNAGSSKAVMQTVIVHGDPKEKIAVISVSGLILDSTAERFNRHMNLAESDPNVKAIVIEVETPGGEITPSDRMYHRIMDFKTLHSKIPVVVSMGNLATSGGYYLSCAADDIVAQPTTLTADIGVLMPSYNFSKLADKWGIEETTVVAPRQGFKNAYSPFAPVKPEDHVYMQALIDEMFGQFKTVVSTSRGSKLTEPIDVIANGKAYLAKEAKTLGLIDSIGYPEDAYAIAARLANLSSRQVVRYHDPTPSVLDLLMGNSGSEESQFPRSGKFGSGGINLNVDANSLIELSTPRMLYLWQGQ